MLKRSLTPLAAAVLVTTGVLSGCVVAPAGPPYGYADDYVGATVTVAPPPLRVEYVGVAPAPGFVWVGGYWNWVGSRHVWVGGRWVQGRPGYHWVPHRWERVPGGWRMARGHWAR